MVEKRYFYCIKTLNLSILSVTHRDRDRDIYSDSYRDRDRDHDRDRDSYRDCHHC